MAFVLPPTLAEVRAAVATRLSFGKQAARSPAMKDLLDEFIRRATREVVLEAHWVELRVRYENDFIDGQDTYDFPDNMEVGRLERLIVVSKDGDEYEMMPDIHPVERARLTSGTEPKDMPVRYEIVNQEIKVVPPPDAEQYPTLAIEGYTRPADPQNNDDRIPVDKEALIQWATALGKAHFQKTTEELTLRPVKDFLKRVRATQTDGSSVQIGGHFSRKFRYAQNRRLTREGGMAGRGNNYWLL
jgi:hypothetical protein